MCFALNTYESIGIYVEQRLLSSCFNKNISYVLLKNKKGMFVLSLLREVCPKKEKNKVQKCQVRGQQTEFQNWKRKESMRDRNSFGGIGMDDF